MPTLQINAHPCTIPRLRDSVATWPITLSFRSVQESTMALTPIDENHARQIQAGMLGRKAGHRFEDELAQAINSISWPLQTLHLPKHVVTGTPSELLLNYIAQSGHLPVVKRATAVSTGALATSDDGARWLKVNGIALGRTKSDIVLTIYGHENSPLICGVSVKHCNHQKPTNAQLFFTTATAFRTMLVRAGIAVPDRALFALRQFCGDHEFRPLDHPTALLNRAVDPRRYFWEEVDSDGKRHWHRLMSEHQDDITKLLLQEAYPNDPFVPQFLLHKTRKSDSWTNTEVAIYTMDELICLSRKYGGFSVRPYRVTKGSFPDPSGVKHEAPRFGIVQMQRGGQHQHPSQLQFNLQAGYFYRIS